MTQNPAHVVSPAAADAMLRERLAQGDAMIATISPILRHLLANDEPSLFGDEIVASVRGMLADIAAQLLDALAPANQGGGAGDHDPAAIADIADSLSAHRGILAHVHALAIEARLASRLEAGQGLDPVLSPLLQALIGSSDPEVASRAMALLAAQARFVQQQRRMQLPLAELPGDLFHAALLALRAQAGEDPAHLAEAGAAEKRIRAEFSEAGSRLGLIAHLVTGMGGGASAALSLSHAGAAIFISALAILGGQDRDMAVLATTESQVARIALVLRAAGLKPAAIAEQIDTLHPGIAAALNLDLIGADHAATLLSQFAAYPGG